MFVKSIYAEPDIDVGKGFLKMQINNVSQVKTIDRVARDLGEDLGLPHDVPLEMEVEEGVIWVYGVDDDGVLAFTDSGVEQTHVKQSARTPAANTVCRVAASATTASYTPRCAASL